MNDRASIASEALRQSPGPLLHPPVLLRQSSEVEPHLAVAVRRPTGAVRHPAIVVRQSAEPVLHKLELNNNVQLLFITLQEGVNGVQGVVKLLQDVCRSLQAHGKTLQGLHYLLARTAQLLTKSPSSPCKRGLQGYRKAFGEWEVCGLK